MPYPAFLALKILIPMALASEGTMLITSPTHHQTSNIDVIHAFLGEHISINISKDRDLLHHISIASK